MSIATLRNTISTCLAIIAGLAASALHARDVVLPAVPDWSVVMPQKLESGQSQSIAFIGAIFRIPVGEKIGSTFLIGTKKPIGELNWEIKPGRSHEFDVATNNRLQQFGYAVVDPTTTAFDDHANAAKVRYQVGVVVSEVKTDYFLKRDGYKISDQSYGVATLGMEVQLQDADTQAIIFKKHYPGYGVDQGSVPKPMFSAFSNAIDHALADPEFVAKLAKADSSVAQQLATYAVMSIAGCKRPVGVKLPAQITEVTEAVIRIRAGNTTGSGIVVSPSGHVLTAAHVVTGRQSVAVRLPSGIELDAQVLRLDTARDIALLQLPGRGYRCAPVAAGLPAVGQDIYAIGTPLGDDLSNTVTRGVVSGHRDLDGVQYVQTDASVSPGTSGGPLMDVNGNIRAIVSMKATGAGVEGIALGVPADVISSKLSLKFE